jgi:hypothetical protein
LPDRKGRKVDEFHFADPKGFSSFTMGIQARDGVTVDPPAVLYRHLDGKESAILDRGEERRVFMPADNGIAARCLHYDDICRIQQDRLVGQTRRAIMASDYMYAVAAVPLAVKPLQKIRFLPHSSQRFARFVAA